MALTSFNMYFSYAAGLAELTDAEAGRLVKGAIRYAAQGIDPAFTGNERYIWAFMRTQIDKDKAAYIAKCEKNAENVRKRHEAGAEQETNGNESVRTITTDNERIRTYTNVNERNYKDNDKDKDKDKYIYKGFTPPTIDEVRAYCTERANGIDPAAFVDYYASQKWKKANGRPVADWRACVRQWEQKRKGEQPTPGATPSALMLKGIKRGEYKCG